MATQSLNVPAGIGVGTSSNVSAISVSRTILAGGTFIGSVLIEASDDGSNWVQVGYFYRAGFINVDVASAFMRVRVAQLDSGTVSSVDVTHLSSAVAVDGLSFDAFLRLRVSDPETLFDSKLVFDGQPLLWDDAEVSGSGTSSAHNTNQASMSLSVGNLTAGMRVRQTWRRMEYQPGKSQLIYYTGVLGNPTTGITARIGSFYEDNGVFFECNPTTLAIGVRTKTSGAAVDTTVAQSAWNVDKMDGTGPSGITLDFTKTQIFVIDFEWLGVGSVRYGMVVNGKYYGVHQTNNANILTMVYMSTPTLPVRYEIANDGTGPAASLVQICSTVISEGGRPAAGQSLSVGRTTPVTFSGNGTRHMLAAGRLANLQSVVIPIAWSVINTANDPYLWELIRDPVLSAGSYTFGGVPNSGVEADGATANITYTTAGTVLASGIGAADAVLEGQTILESQLGASIAGVPSIFALVVTKLQGGGSDNFYGSMTWRESS